MNFARSMAAAASAGLILGTLTACGGSGAPAADASDAPGAEGQACCRGLHDCKGKGGCAVEGKWGCAGQNECKGQGGCNHHCPS